MNCRPATKDETIQKLLKENQILDKSLSIALRKLALIKSIDKVMEYLDKADKGKV